MGHWLAGFELPTTWVDLRSLSRVARHRSLAAELRRELGPGHPLSEVRWRVVAASEARDDVVLALDDGRAAVTHLTWTASPPERPPWPSTEILLTGPALRAALALRDDEYGDVPTTAARTVTGGAEPSGSGDGSVELTRVDDDFHPLVLTAGRSGVRSAVDAWAGAGLTVRVVRGRKMRTLAALFDELAAALQFPSHFGEDKDAFAECIADLSGVPAGTGYVLGVLEPDQVLADADADDLGWLTRSFAAAAAEWGRPVALGEWWDRPPVPFHVVLIGEAPAVTVAERRWTTSGVAPIPIG